MLFGEKGSAVIGRAEWSKTAIALETATCPVCGAAGEACFEQTDLLCGIPGVFGQRKCATCEGFFLSPRVPEQRIGSYYPESYVPYQPERESWLTRQVVRIFQLGNRRRRIVERFLPGGRLLDVGCGNGEFLRTLQDRPGIWARYASDTKWNGAGECPGEFHAGQFDTQAPPVGDLDAVTLWHVFEHLYHPEQALENAREILRPGGFLFLAIPDLKSVEPHLFGKYWVGWDPPRHVATYSAKGMEVLLKRAGFELVDVVPDITSGALLLMNVDFALKARGISWELRQSLWLRLLATPLVWMLSVAGFAPAKVYVAQR